MRRLLACCLVKQNMLQNSLGCLYAHNNNNTKQQPLGLVSFLLSLSHLSCPPVQPWMLLSSRDDPLMKCLLCLLPCQPLPRAGQPLYCYYTCTPAPDCPTLCEAWSENGACSPPAAAALCRCLRSLLSVLLLCCFEQARPGQAGNSNSCQLLPSTLSVPRFSQIAGVRRAQLHPRF